MARMDARDAFRNAMRELITARDADLQSRVERTTTSSGELLTSELNAPLGENQHGVIDAVSVKVTPNALSAKTDLAGMLVDFVTAIQARLRNVLTTKGDLVVRSATAPDRLAVGADGQVLTASSAQPLGVTWAAVTVPAHDHDDRYYTETESDAKYALAEHTHAGTGAPDYLYWPDGTDPDWLTDGDGHAVRWSA